MTRASCAPWAIEPVPLAGTMLSDSRVGSAVNVHVNDTAAGAGWLSTTGTLPVNRSPSVPGWTIRMPPAAIDG